MVAPELLEALPLFLAQRRIEAGTELLETYRDKLECLEAGEPGVGTALGLLAQWTDVGFDDEGLLARLIESIPRSAREMFSLADYVHLRTAEAVLAMAREELASALRHLETALTLSEDLADPTVRIFAMFWKARCLRKAGEYDQAIEITRRAVETAAGAGLEYIAAVIRTLESWLLFQKGETKQAISILQEAEVILRKTDDFIALGNIQSSYGRIALREGRYDHAMQHFDASIDFFRRRPALQAYLARSLTNIAQAKRFLALQLRRSIDAQRRTPGQRASSQEKAGQLERMHELLRSAQVDLAHADAIYTKRGNHHGAGNADVNLAQIFLDLGDLHQAEERAHEAFELGATKADYLLMCRARIVEAMVANARFEEQIGETEDPSRFAQLAHDCAREAVDLGKRTESRRLLAQAYICQGTTLVNGFFNNTEMARACCDRAEGYLGSDRHDALWQELEELRATIAQSGLEDPNLRAWSQGAIGDKSLQDVVAEFEELLIRRVWEHEGRKVARVARKLSVSPKKVRRALRRLGLMVEQPESDEVAT
jgi:tetratricopeptide (TPR) repeat protein